MASIINGRGFVGVRTGTVSSGPSIVTNGLKLYLDAGNTSSYPGTGTVWTDISGNGNNGTLVNGGTGLSYNSANGGNIVFDGTNDYIKPPNSTTLQSNNFTLSSWVNVSTLGINQYFIDTSSSSFLGYGYSYRIKSDNKIRFWAYDSTNALDTTITVLANSWYNIVATYNNTSKTQTIYVNGNLSVTNTHTNTFNLSTISYLQIGKSQLLDGPLNGKISNVQIYNRDLSATEILQNYNALKSRFGL
jgi:hypothetical protein